MAIRHSLQPQEYNESLLFTLDLSLTVTNTRYNTSTTRTVRLILGTPAP